MAVRPPMLASTPEESPVELTLVAPPESPPKAKPSYVEDKRISADGQASRGLGVRVGQGHARCVAAARRRRRSSADAGWKGEPGTQLWRTRSTRQDRCRVRRRLPFSRARKRLPSQDGDHAGGPKPKMTPRPSTQLALLEPPSPKNASPTENGEGGPQPQQEPQEQPRNSRRPHSLPDISLKPGLLGSEAIFPIAAGPPSAPPQPPSAVTRKCSPTRSAPDGTTT